MGEARGPGYLIRRGSQRIGLVGRSPSVQQVYVGSTWGSVEAPSRADLNPRYGFLQMHLVMEFWRVLLGPEGLEGQEGAPRRQW